MASQWKMLRCVLVLLLFVCINECIARRTSGGGGFKNKNRSQGGGGYPQQQQHTYQQGNSNPSAPQPPANNRPVGFEHFNQPNSGSGNIGFQNAQQHPVPQQNSQPNVGFNVPQGQPPQGGYQNTHFNQQPQGGYQNTHYNQPGYQNPQYNQPGYQNTHYNQPGYQNTHYNQPNYGGYPHQPGYSQPGTYYNPQYSVPQGVQPVVYQPQKSSGGSLLGYAGAFAGGALIGSLATNALSSNHQPYTVNHFYQNSEVVPKQTSVPENRVVTCLQNETQGLCVPNTFPLCLVNGTIMCVTHIQYAVPCQGLNTSLACVISILPCNSSDCTSLPSNATFNGNNTSANTTSANNTVSDIAAHESGVEAVIVSPNSANTTSYVNGTVMAANTSTTTNSTSDATRPTNFAIYIPCISNVTVNTAGESKTIFCVTAIANPKVPKVFKDAIVQDNPQTKSSADTAYSSKMLYLSALILWIGIK